MSFWIIAALLVGGVIVSLTRLLPTRQRLHWVITLLVPAITLGLYILLGRPELTAWHSGPALPPVIAGAVERLQQAVRENPQDAGSWALLGDVYRRVGRHREAAAAYGHASAIDPADPDLQLARAQSLVALAGGRVGGEALSLFQKTAADPVAQDYLALAIAQDGDWQTALTKWQGLATSLPPDDDLQPRLNGQIELAKRALAE